METLRLSFDLILSGDAALWSIVFLSLKVSLTATVLASLIGIPVGAALAVWSFPFSRLVLVVLTTFMALPPVVVGLGVYLTLSRAGPFGALGLLFTPGAMIIAQTILILPIVTVLTRDAVLPLHRTYRELLLSLDTPPFFTIRSLIVDARFAIATAFLAGFGRAIAEVGAVLIVGGNIDGVTRVMTTTIALETSKGNLELALALGFILILMAFSVNLVIHVFSRAGARYQLTS